MALSLFNVAFALAALNNNKKIASNTKLADSVVAGLLPNGLGLAFPLIVNAQNQAPTTIATTTTSSGGGTVPTLTEVPDVIGKSFQDASSSLTSAGLGPPIQQLAYDSNPKTAGNVVEQDPDADTFVPLGSSVTLVVSSGPYLGQQSLAISPDVIKQFEAAQQQMRDELASAVAQKLRENEPELLNKIEHLLEKRLGHGSKPKSP